MTEARSLHLTSYIAGEPVESEDLLEVFNPYNGQPVGTVTMGSPADAERAMAAAVDQAERQTRYQRSQVLLDTREALLKERETIAQLIMSESGLCLRETRYEVGRASDVLQFAAMEALRDDGQIFSCDVSPQGKQRKIFTTREPVRLALAITPFNHPLNQVVHKLAPAVAAGVPVILKPPKRTPLTAIRLVEMLYQAGLPADMLSVLVGDNATVIEPMIMDPRVELVSFTGSTGVGKKIATLAGYKKTCLELGGNAPLIILEDADMDLAVKLAAEGCYRNSGQRCTAVKRLLVHDDILEEFTSRLVAISADAYSRATFFTPKASSWIYSATYSMPVPSPAWVRNTGRSKVRPKNARSSHTSPNGLSWGSARPCNSTISVSNRREDSASALRVGTAAPSKHEALRRPQTAGRGQIA